jgi:prepilin-type processing-associated H-X9-DG protein
MHQQPETADAFFASICRGLPGLDHSLRKHVSIEIGVYTWHGTMLGFRPYGGLSGHPCPETYVKWGTLVCPELAALGAPSAPVATNDDFGSATKFGNGTIAYYYYSVYGILWPSNKGWETYMFSTTESQLAACGFTRMGMIMEWDKDKSNTSAINLKKAKAPSNTYIYGDAARPVSSAAGWGSWTFSNGDGNVTGLTDRHQGRTVVSFLDGHAGSYSMRSLRKTATGLKQYISIRRGSPSRWAAICGTTERIKREMMMTREFYRRCAVFCCFLRCSRTLKSKKKGTACASARKTATCSKWSTARTEPEFPRQPPSGKPVTGWKTEPTSDKFMQSPFNGTFQYRLSDNSLTMEFRSKSIQFDIAFDFHEDFFDYRVKNLQVRGETMTMLAVPADFTFPLRT